MSDGISIESHHEERRPVLFSSSGPCRRSSIAPYCDRVRAVLSPYRFAHVMRVAELAETIARANGFEAQELRATCLAAILHDVARDLSDERLVALAPPDNDMERSNPIALHGRAGRVIAREWGVTDERVLGAIEGHVLGVRPGDRIGMAVYVADISEPGRDVNADIRELAMRDLARAYRRAVEAKVRYLRRCGKDVHPRTLKVHDEFAHAT
jgi:predicted HD superfamily hydrolase involved in NAD metabolism